MIVELNDKDAQNVYVSLIRMSKQLEVDVPTMKYLLGLSDKFMVKPAVEPEVIDSKE